jgi:hypothetical protein
MMWLHDAMAVCDDVANSLLASDVLCGLKIDGVPSVVFK